MQADTPTEEDVADPVLLGRPLFKTFNIDANGHPYRGRRGWSRALGEAIFKDI